MNFPWHPINRLPELIANRIPIAISYGTEDQTVPYAENGQLLTEAYEKTDIPFLAVPRDWQGHHPHGLADPAQIVEFIVEKML